MRVAVRVVQQDGVARMVAPAVDTIFPDSRHPMLTEYGEAHEFVSVLAADMWIRDFMRTRATQFWHADIQDLDDPERGPLEPEE